MNIEELRADFEAWWATRHPATSIKEDAFAAYQAGRAALQSQPTEAFPCQIIEADFETGAVTLEMEGKYTVSAGQKYLCNAPLQSQDREDMDQWLDQLRILITEFGIACADSGAVEMHMMPKMLDHARRNKDIS